MHCDYFLIDFHLLQLKGEVTADTYLCDIVGIVALKMVLRRFWRQRI